MNHIARAVEICGGPSKLATILGVSAQAVCFWRDGKRNLPVELMTQIERATDGRVTRQQLRPDDWQRIWPELAEQARKGAPQLGAGQAAPPGEDDGNGQPTTPLSMAGDRRVHSADLCPDGMDAVVLPDRRVA